MVTVITSDNKIWNKEQVIIDIIKLSQTENKIVIDLNSEGPCCESVGLDNLLDDIIQNFNILPDRIIIQTANQLQSSKFNEVRTSNCILSGAIEKIKHYNPTYSTLEKTFGIFVGRSNWKRLGLASYIWNNYKDKSNVTFHYNVDKDFHRSNFGLETLLHKHLDDLDNIANFIKELPLTYDSITYPILWSDNAYNLDELYKDIFCEIICETYFSGTTFFISEKTYRCILNKRPFIVQGPQWYLKNLRRLGFKTFSKWWDEGYDEDPSDGRYVTLKQNIDWIGEQNRNIIKSWYEEMRPILEHNYNMLSNLTNKQILSTEFFYE